MYKKWSLKKFRATLISNDFKKFTNNNLRVRVFLTHYWLKIVKEESTGFRFIMHYYIKKIMYFFKKYILLNKDIFIFVKTYQLTILFNLKAFLYIFFHKLFNFTKNFFKKNTFFLDVIISFFKLQWGYFFKLICRLPYLYKYLLSFYKKIIFLGLNYPLFGIENEIDDSILREFTWLYLDWLRKKNTFLFEYVNCDYIVARLRRICKKNTVNITKRQKYLYISSESNFNRQTFFEKQKIFLWPRKLFFKKYFRYSNIYNTIFLMTYITIFQFKKNLFLKFFYMFAGKTGFIESKSISIWHSANEHFVLQQLYRAINFDEISSLGRYCLPYWDQNSGYFSNFCVSGWWPNKGKTPCHDVSYIHLKYDLYNKYAFDYYWFIVHRSESNIFFKNYTDCNEFDNLFYLVMVI